MKGGEGGNYFPVGDDQYPFLSSSFLLFLLPTPPPLQLLLFTPPFFFFSSPSFSPLLYLSLFFSDLYFL